MVSLSDLLIDSGLTRERLEECRRIAGTTGDSLDRVILSKDYLNEGKLLEAYARHLGYDRIPVVVTEMTATAAAPHLPTMEVRARDALAEAGFHESSGYAMLASGEDQAFVSPETPAP